MIANKIEENLLFANENIKDLIVGKREIISKIIESKISNPKNYQFYLDFILGYLSIKPNALPEDLEMCIDTAVLYRQRPDLFENFKYFHPLELGKKHQEIRKIVNEELLKKTKNEILKLKSEGKLLEGMTLNKIYEHEGKNKYEFYYVPALPKPCTAEEIEKQHVIYCALGKGTDWCTASPTGTYFQDYVHDDIYVIMVNGQPTYQFNIRKGKINQFMDSKDNFVRVLPKSIIEILERLLDENVQEI